MADEVEQGNLDLKANHGSSERNEKFWNTSTVEMKSLVEKKWIKAVRVAKNKPNYGMGEMDPLHEETVHRYFGIEVGHQIKNLEDMVYLQ
ncbi:hypothetical protein ACROYT_G035900 [Oculina patagonica]